MRTPVSTVAGPSVRAPRRAVPGAAVVLALALVGVVAAQGHTGDRRQQAGIVLVDPTAMAAPRPTAAAAQPHPVPVGQPQPLARIPVAEAQQRVPFPIRLPAQLPTGLILRGVIVAPGPSADGVPGPPQVDVGYGAADRPDAGLHIQETLGTVQGGYVVDATKAQQIVIAGHPAVYASVSPVGNYPAKMQRKRYHSRCTPLMDCRIPLSTHRLVRASILLRSRCRIVGLMPSYSAVMALGSPIGMGQRSNISRFGKHRLIASPHR